VEISKETKRINQKNKKKNESDVNVNLITKLTSNVDYHRNYLCLGKHSLQYTGLPSVGLNGTSVSTPQSEQVTFVISLGPLLPRKPPEFPLEFLSLKAIFVSPPL
jgi:hypothetical protein